MKKLLSILLVVVMLLSLAPMTLASEESEEPAEAVEVPVTEEPETEPAKAEEPAAEEEEPPAEDGVTIYPLWVGGVQVTSANASNILGDNTARYDRATKTLTFSGLTGLTNYYIHRINDHYGVYTTEDLTVAGTASFNVDMDGTTYGIYSTGVLTIAEGADLTIRAWNDVLVGKEGVIINGGRINLTSVLGACIDVPNHSLVVNDGTVNLKSNLMAIDAQQGEITVNGGTVTATTTGEDGVFSIRLFGGTLTVNGGVLDVTNTGGGNALDEWDHVTYASTLKITEGSLDGSHFRIEPKVLSRIDLTAMTTELSADQPIKADAVLASGSRCTIVDQFWLHGGEKYTGSAMRGETYQYVGIFRAKDGYSFGPNGTPLPVYLNGVKLTDGHTVTKYYGYEDVFYFTIDCKLEPLLLTSAAVTGLDAPALDQTGDTSVSVPGGAHYTVDKILWYDKTADAGTALTGDWSFQAGHTYTCSVWLKAKDGYVFERGFTASLNGENTSRCGLIGAGDTSDTAWIEYTKTLETVEVTLNCNGGRIRIGVRYFSTLEKTVAVGQPYGTLRTPTRDGYTFAGWYTTRILGTMVTEDTVCEKTTDHTLYARWIKDEEPEEPDILLGDVNGDGKVNPADRAALARYLAKWPDYQDINLANADVNGDGNVNPADRAYLARYFAKWPDYAVLGKPAA